MDPNKVGDLARSIAARVVSLDQSEIDSVINEYFDSNCTLNTRLIQANGVTQVKKLVSLEAALASKSRLVGPPHYDTEKGSITFSYERIFYPPAIPPSLPFAGRINTHLRKARLNPIWDSELHLNPSNDEGVQARLYVTKVGPRVRRGRDWWEQYLPFALLQPVMSVLLILAADLHDFLAHHPIEKEGFVSVAFSAAVGLWNWFAGSTKANGTMGALAWPLSVISTMSHCIFDPLQITLSLVAAAFHSTITFTRDTLQTDGSALTQVQSYIVQALNIAYSKVRQLVWTWTDRGRTKEKTKEMGVPLRGYREAVGEGAAAFHSTTTFTRNTIQTYGSALTQGQSYIILALNIIYSQIRHLVWTWTVRGRAEDGVKGMGVSVSGYREAVEEGVGGVRQRVGEVSDALLKDSWTNSTVKTWTNPNMQVPTLPEAPSIPKMQASTLPGVPSIPKMQAPTLPGAPAMPTSPTVHRVRHFLGSNKAA